MAGNFRNTTLGLGVLTVNGVDVGLLKGNVKLDVKATILPFKSGVPLQTQGQVITEEEVSLTASAAEINADNLQLALGRGSKTVNVAAPVTLTMQPYTMGAVPGGHYDEYVVLAGPGLSAVTVKNAVEAVTYVNNTDYYIDAASGVIYRNPSGAITSGQVLHITYTYTPVASEQVNFGASFVLSTVMVDFTHTSPVSGSIHTIKFWTAQGSGTLAEDFGEAAYQLLNLEFKSQYDSTHPSNPTGYQRVVYMGGAAPSA